MKKIYTYIYIYIFTYIYIHMLYLCAGVAWVQEVRKRVAKGVD